MTTKNVFQVFIFLAISLWTMIISTDRAISGEDFASDAPCNINGLPFPVIPIFDEGYAANKTPVASAVLLGESGYVITAWHALGGLKNRSNIEFFFDNKRFSPILIRKEPDIDLALLKIPSFELGRQLSEVPPVSKSDGICLVGYPVSKMGTKSAVSGRIIKQNSENIVIGSPIEDGYSGGGAFQNNELFGLILGSEGKDARLIGFDAIEQFLLPNVFYDKEQGLFKESNFNRDFTKKYDDLTKRIHITENDIIRLKNSAKWSVSIVNEEIRIIPEITFFDLYKKGSFSGTLIGTYITENTSEDIKKGEIKEQKDYSNLANGIITSAINKTNSRETELKMQKWNWKPNLERMLFQANNMPVTERDRPTIKTMTVAGYHKENQKFIAIDMKQACISFKLHHRINDNKNKIINFRISGFIIVDDIEINKIEQDLHNQSQFWCD